ncbi:glycosyltransferase family 2 protein [Hyalangium versicolor]|uniref:glycosyltransferase family 2 protein n=1 Tax=Hyalangium versicolor TaxID=2861190 RepID=UPI001CCD8790|nr:glycosyltransferase family 2 protein [Hyalangium versicolor]
MVEAVPDLSWEVPASRVVELRPRRTRYCVCIPVINEGEKLAKQLSRMQPLMDTVDVIIADGGSTDSSVASELVGPAGVRTVLVKTGPGKLSAQMRMAFAYALEQGYEGIVTIDGNNKDDPGAIPLFLKALDEGYDHVQGSRFIPGGEAENTPPMRWLGIRLVHAPLISLAAGARYTDTTNGFRAYSRRFLADPRVAPFRDVFSRYELHYYLAIRAPELGFRVLEVPVSRRYPGKGPVPTKISAVRGNLLVLQTLMNACLHRYDPPSSSREQPHA